MIFIFIPLHLNRNPCVVGQAETLEAGAEVLDDPDDNPPGDHTGAGWEVLTLRVHPSDYPGLVVHDVAARQAKYLQQGNIYFNHREGGPYLSSSILSNPPQSLSSNTSDR